MAKVKYLAPRTGLRTMKYKTGASGGGFGTNPAAQPSGACLTYTANDEVGLAGAGDAIECFLDSVDDTKGTCRVYTPNVGEISEIITNGTLTAGDSLIGHSDTDRGKAATAQTADALKARWVVKSASAGKANVTPRA